MNEHNNVVELYDEKGDTAYFEYLMTIDYGEKEYVILSPLGSEEDEEMEENLIVILSVQQDEDGDDMYVSIDDEKEIEEVFNAFNHIINEEI